MTTEKIKYLIKNEEKRQKGVLEMIPSENYASKDVRDAVGSVLMNKYSEGQAGKRYYQGNKFIDEIEYDAIEQAKKLFRVPYANVQAYSGSPANSAVYFSLLERDDIIMGLELASGGHLTHGHPKVTFSGRFFKSVQYSVEKNGLIDYSKLEKLAKQHKPKIIVSGTTAYPRKLNFKKFGEIADKVGAWHLADISHIAGLVATRQHQSPVPYAHVVMLTTHKTLRGPRGAILLVTKLGLKKDPELANKLDKGVFPGLQGGPHNNTTAAIAICLAEAATSKFVKYAKQVVANAKVLAQELKKYDFNLVSGGTDNHLILIDLTNRGIDGWCAAWALEYAGIVLNRNSVPYDTKSAFYPSGIRLGTPAVTTRGMKEKEMLKIAQWLNKAINIAKEYVPATDSKETRLKFKNSVTADKRLKAINLEIKRVCAKFPLP